MWMPEWLYERLPTLYLVAAAACLWTLGVSFATGSSALLLLAAALRTRSLRRSARQPLATRARRHGGPPHAPPADHQRGGQARVDSRAR